MQKLICKKRIWLNLHAPSKKEIKDIQNEYNIHPLISGELMMPTYRPKVEAYKDQLFLVLHFPVIRSTGSPAINREIDFIIGKNYLITSHYGNIPFINNLYKELSDDKNRCTESFGSNSGHLLHFIITKLFNSLLEELDHFSISIDGIEKNIFKRQEDMVVEDISKLRHQLLNFRRALKPQQTILESLEERGKIFFGTGMSPYFADIIGEYIRVWHILENHKETLDALHDTNTSLLSTRSNETMQKLTIMAFITFPLTLIASIFGMNTRWLPFMGSPNDFWFVMGVMFVGVGGMFWYFKSKHWL